MGGMERKEMMGNEEEKIGGHGSFHHRYPRHQHGLFELFPRGGGDGDRICDGCLRELHGRGGAACTAPVALSSADGGVVRDLGLDRKGFSSLNGSRNARRLEDLDSWKGVDVADSSCKLQSLGIVDCGYGDVCGNGGVEDGGVDDHPPRYGNTGCPVLNDFDREKGLMMLRFQEQCRLDGSAGMGLDSNSLMRKRIGEQVQSDDHRSMMSFNHSGLHEPDCYQGFLRAELNKALQNPYRDELRPRPGVDYGVLPSEVMLARPAWGIDSDGHQLQRGVMMKPNVRPNPYNDPRMRSMSGFEKEDSFILEGNHCPVKNPMLDFRKGLCRCEIGRRKLAAKQTELSSFLEGNPWDNLYAAFPYQDNLLSEFHGLIYDIAKDQTGCRFLQKKIAKGNPQDFQMMFCELIHHMVELMMNPFANYLVQLMLDVCTEDQIIQITNVVTAKPMELVKISLNRHGTRAVQKLIQTIKTDQQILSVAVALEPGFPELITDGNGNHVVQCCLEYFPFESIQFIIKAAARYCIEIAIHQDGCRVLQRCIRDAVGDVRTKMCADIAGRGVFLAQNNFGNYVIQYIIDQGIPSVNAILHSNFEGSYVHLSVQKHSSNVVEKCICCFGYEARCKIIEELLSASPFDNFLQDKYANYVIKTALSKTEGTSIYSTLVAAILPYEAILGTSPFCKRIFSMIKLRTR